jgi:carboxypeptidase family protein/TonB-dependent receptor-like protein
MLTGLSRGFVLTLASSLLLLFATSAAASADDLDNIVFEGVIRDSAGAVIPAAKIVATHLTTGVERTAVSNGEGRFRISVNAPGNYKLKAIANGFKEEQSQEVAVVTGRTFTIDFALTAAGVTEQVTVAATSTPLVDTNRTVVGDTINQRELEELPIIDRDPLQLVFLLGGVTEAPLDTSQLANEGRGVFLRGTPEEAGNFSLTGAPATSNNITIDGLDNNDDRSARERISLNPESIAELQIITNQYAAEYGRASGGRINIRTKGGTNRYHGDVYSFFADESLNANTYFRNARGLGRVLQQQRREGGVFGGPMPIRHEKDFFFASYERLDVTDFAEINALVPVATNPLFVLPKPTGPAAPGSSSAPFFEELSTPESSNLVNARADFNFAQSHNAAVRFDLLRGANQRGFSGGTRLPDTILIQGRNSDSISLSDFLISSNKLVNQARFQYSRLLPRDSAGLDSLSISIKSPSLTAGSYSGTNTSPAFAREERRTQVQDNISFLYGSHVFKAGADVQLVRSTYEDLFATGGQFTFDTVEDFLANNPSRFVQRFDTKSTLSNNVVGLFAQDEWKIIPNLTLSYGMRWDNESVLNDNKNFSPRVAIAWDPFGGKLFRRFKKFSTPGKTVVRAGFGLFYNRALLRTLDDFSLGASTIIVDSDVSPALLPLVHFPQPITDNSLIDKFGLAETKFLRRVSPDLEIPYTLQTGLGIERQLTKSLVATADYIYTRGAHLWRETNANAPVLPEGFQNFTQYLLSRDFDNRAGSSGGRPISGATADVVRFDTSANTSSSSGAIKVENGVRVLTLGLNTPRSANITAALSAIRSLRPNPSLTQVEVLESTGNSFYHGGIFSLRYSLGRRAHFRAVYTLSKLVDEGTTNTASPQNLFDRRAERSLSLQDQRHRFTFSGLFQVPYVDVDLAPIISFGSSKPFNIGSGFDRNLNDIQNDRPGFLTEIGRPEWRRPGSAPASDVQSALGQAPIGSDGDLPRNYGIGPGTQTINLRASRTFVVRDHIRVRPSVDVFNVFNNTVFSFGSEFIDQGDATFLVPQRTQRPRTILLGLKVTF